MLTRVLGFLHIYSLFTKKTYTLLNKTRFSLAFLSFFRNIGFAELTIVRKRNQKLRFLFCFSLTYS